MVKNDDRLASLLGTWTGQSHIKAFSVGHYELLVYFVVHIMPDPMRGYGCSLPATCIEMENQVCLEHDKNKEVHQECVDMTNATVPWSDVTAFLYFGARVDAGVPFNVHIEHNTSGWIGPFNLILAQDSSNVTTLSLGGSNNTSLTPDKYVARYVKTLATPLLQMPPGCTIFGEEDFEHQMGATAVNETVHAQTRIGHGEDPYEYYLGNCSHGNVKPILPLYEFIFTPQKDNNSKNKNNKNNSKVVDQLRIKLDYKIMTMPHPKDIAYKIMPRLQSLFNNRKHGEFHISGPYCYGDDPHRGWTFDFSYDSELSEKKKYMSLVHGCVEDLPCVPPAGALGSIHDSQHMIYYNSSSDGGGDGTSSLNLDKVIISILCYILLLALLVSITCNCRQSRLVKRLKQEQEQRDADDDLYQYNHNYNHHHHHHHQSNDNNNNNHARGEGAAAAATTTGGGSETLLQPLLSHDQNVFDGTDNLLAGHDENDNQVSSEAISNTKATTSTKTATTTTSSPPTTESV